MSNNKITLQVNSELPNDEKVLQVMEQLKIPVNPNFLSHITGIPSNQLAKNIKSLQKFGFIRKVACVKSTFYIIIKEED